MRRAIFAVVTLMCLSGCGSGGDDETASSAGGGTTAADTAAPEGDAERQVERVFEEYNAALVRGDYPAGCRYLAPETIAKLRANLEKLVGSAPEGCEASLSALYEQLEEAPEQKRQLTEIARSARIDQLEVTGDSAIIDWSAMSAGKRVKISQSARLVDGEWKLVDVSN